MLVLTRKTSEKIHIGDDIVVTLLEVKGSRVRIGIEAPNHVTILRAELTERGNLELTEPALASS